LRAVAIVAVVLYHAHVGFAGGGYVGVDVFFVVSGFLITGLLWRELERHGRISFASFYGRRVRRLLPMSVLVVIVTLIASAQWLPPLQLHDVIKDAIASSLYVANFRFALQSTSYLASSAPPSPFQHFWSLAVEEQFYLVWPALLVGIWTVWCRVGRHSRHRAAVSQAKAAGALLAVCVGSFALSLWLTSTNQPWAFFLLPSRAWELGAGGLLALGAPWCARLSKATAVCLGWGGVALIVWSITRLSGTTAFPGVAALAPVAGTVAVIAAGSNASVFGPVALLGRRSFQVIGTLSYSWYLWHWPVLVIAPAIVGHALGVWDNLGLVAFSGVIAAVSVVVVEAPIRYSRRLALRSGSALALAGALTAAAVVSCGLVAVTLPSLQGHGVAVLAGQAAQAAPADPGAGPLTTVDPATTA
jgi:peptidoglycan/LPS O-acetylase OafA/YrhL